MLQKCVLHIGRSQRLRDKNTETDQKKTKPNQRKSTEEREHQAFMMRFVSSVCAWGRISRKARHMIALSKRYLLFSHPFDWVWASAVLYAPWYHTLSVTKLSDRNELNVFTNTSHYNGFCLYLNKITANEKLTIIKKTTAAHYMLERNEKKRVTAPATAATIVAVTENLAQRQIKKAK